MIASNATISPTKNGRSCAVTPGSSIPDAGLGKCWSCTIRARIRGGLMSCDPKRLCLFWCWIVTMNILGFKGEYMNNFVIMIRLYIYMTDKHYHKYVYIC